MPSAVAVRARSHIARPLPVLVPLIQEELEDGNRAGLEHYCKAGELLLEAREQVAEFKWGKWLKANFALSRQTAYNYMTLAERIREDPDLVNTSLQSMFGIVRPKEQQRRKAQRAAFKLHKSVALFDAARQARAEETRLHRILAVELIDVGFKALATRLHPDHGGSDMAMRRLNKVRRELKSVAQTRRFE
jgi:Protein of unknown function (DUF3102)